VTIGVGYIIRDVQFTIVDEAGTRNNIKSNLELKLDLRLADNQTVIRRILEGFNQPTAGQKRTTIKFTADYRLSRRLAAQFYYDQTKIRNSKRRWPSPPTNGRVELPSDLTSETNPRPIFEA